MGDSAEGASTSGSGDDYEQALIQYDKLVRKYQDETGELNEADIVILESEVVKALCKTLSLRPRIRNGIRPQMHEWLRVVGLSATNIRHIQLLGYHDVLALIQLPDNEVKSLAERGRYSPESKRRVLKSCEAVRNYFDVLQGRRDDVNFTDKQLSWSVKLSPSLARTTGLRGTSVESISPLNSPRFVVTTVDQRTYERDSPGSAELLIPSCSGSGSFPGSPSPSTTGHSRSASGSGSLSVLTGRTTLSPSSPLSTSTHSTPTLGVNSRVTHSVSLQFDNMDGSQRSPQLSRMNHAIPHKWHRSTKLRLMSDQTCTVCQRPLGLGFVSSWEKCKSCKWKVHTQCKSRIGDTCGLTPDHLRHWVERLISQHNTGIWNDTPIQETVFPFPPEVNNVADSSSSTNSSAPSTPAALGIGTLSSPYTQFPAPPSSKSRFTFPDTVQEVEIPDIVLPEGTGDSPEMPRTADQRLDSSEGTVIGDSTGSAGTDLTLSDGSNGGRSPGHTWDRHRWTMSTIRGGNPQAGWKEVTIALADIEFKKNPNPLLGHGRFGDVLRGYHFGDVAVKFLNMDHIEESRRLDEFKAEVAAHKNTRHDNIVLFLGCCMEEGRLAIAMSLCKGQSLYRILHETKEKLELGTAHHIATQICQGISYLHTKKILHKDLRTKNVFIENNYKVIITDFGLASMKRLRNPPRDNSLQVSQHWLVYQSPEIIQSIALDGRELPYSEMSDAYSFGTVWYELLTYSFPFAKEHPDRIIYIVGHGLKPPLHNIKTSKEAKPRILEILMRCWSFSGDDRPAFSEISNLLNSLPRRRLDRSPSFPMIRSFESNF